MEPVPLSSMETFPAVYIILTQSGTPRDCPSVLPPYFNRYFRGEEQSRFHGDFHLQTGEPWCPPVDPLCTPKFIPTLISVGRVGQGAPAWC